MLILILHYYTMVDVFRGYIDTIRVSNFLDVKIKREILECAREGSLV